MAEEKSSRHKLADRFAKLIRDSGFNNPYGGRVFLTSKNERKFYSMGFSFLGMVTGTVNIYEDNFIQIDYRYGKMVDSPVFESEDAAVSFFKEGVVSRKWEKALKIPNKPPKKDD